MGHLESIILKTTTMFKLVKVSFIKSLEKTNKSLLKDKNDLLAQVEKIDFDLKNERHKNLLLKSKLTDFEYKAESLVKEIERLTDKYIPKHAKDGKFTGKNN